MNGVIRLITIVFSLAGCGMLVGAGVSLQRTPAFRSDAVRAEGRVIENIARHDSDGTTYAPHVEYVAADGRNHHFVTSSSSSPALYDPGERVTVLHDPARPHQARIDGWMDNWFLPTLLGGMGLAFAGVGGGFVVARALRRRRWLEIHGTRIEARFTGVERDTSLTVNGRSPWRLMCQ